MSALIEDPIAYAAAKLPTLRRRWDGPIGDAVRAHGPRLWPGVPPTALLGLTASSMGVDEIGPAPDFVRGVFGVERSRIPALAASAAAYLGRDVPADAERKGRGYMGDIEAQVVTGIMGYLRHLDGVRQSTRVPVSALWVADDARCTSWSLRVAAAAYSSGDARPRAVLAALAAELAPLAPAERWPHQAARVAAWPEKTIGGMAVEGKWRAAFMCLRAEQRLESGLALERAIGGGREAWWAPWCAARPELVTALQKRAEGR